MCENPVLPHHRHQIGRYAHHQQIKQRHQAFERDAASGRIGLNQLETHSAAGQVIERIVAVLAFRIQDGNCCRQLIFGKMMIADDHVYAFARGVGDFFVGLDPAVKRDDKGKAVL